MPPPNPRVRRLAVNDKSGSGVTLAAEDCQDYDWATEPEAASGRVIERAPSEWRSLAA